MKRIILMLALTALLVVALSMSALSAFAATPACEAEIKGSHECSGNKLETKSGSHTFGKFTGR